MKKQYNTPHSERIAFHAEPLMDTSKVGYDPNKSNGSDQNLTNEHDYNDSWDDLGD